MCDGSLHNWRVGLKGADRSPTAGEVSTEGANATEARSEPPEASGRGLSIRSRLL
jgi:hypothetical protein